MPHETNITHHAREIMHPITNGFFERIEFEPYGTLRLIGWTRGPMPKVNLVINSKPHAPVRHFRRLRHDLYNIHNDADRFHGFAIEFDVESKYKTDTNKGAVYCEETRFELLQLELDLLHTFKPGYSELLSGKRVLHRNDIYNVGFPTDDLHPDIVELALQLSGTTLDIGCGAGPFVRLLRSKGISALGLEIDRKEIKSSLRNDVAPFIKLYDGSLPLPFASGSFDSVLCTEVLEHVPNYEQLISEIARIVTKKVVITVPDMSCLPAGSCSGFIPWHLLEGSHVNFFNPVSLRELLSHYFDSVTLFQLAHSRVNGIFMPGSMGAIAEKVNTKAQALA